MGLTRVTMGARLNFYKCATGAKFSTQIHAAAAIVTGSTLPHSTQELVRIRASQINGSSFCTGIHIEDAARTGEKPLRLNLIAAWRGATVFTDAERAALELTEQVTRVDSTGDVSDDVWANVCRHYDDDQAAALVSQIALINTFNRVNVITRQPADRDELVKLHEREYPSGRPI